MSPEERPGNIVPFPSAARDETLVDSGLIIRFVRGGDDAAFEELVARYYAPALAVARARLRDEELAQDIVQEAFIRVFRERGRYDPTRSFAAWFYTILRNIATDAIRGRVRYRRKLEILADGEAEVPPVGALALDCAALLSCLSGPERETLVYYHIHGMSLRQIAELLHISAEAAKKRVQRALKKLKAVVSQNSSRARTASGHEA
ncbi:MAG TPA: sigma-70 family RNA polymerase sigma factor [Verrucomicrobiae bacterium]|nr:sigma-70 family RNA polymerase sigma factor [Verrucomicrobiae bacterium]